MRFPDRNLTAGRLALTLAALGVVFGDIGTSPLYALQVVFSIDGHTVRATSGDVYGVVSLVFWSIVLVVAVKYLTFILRADNDGEGGIMALTALVQSVRGRAATLVVLAVTGAEALYADMGQFRRRPIRVPWFALALPALALNYLGRAGLILHDPRAIASPFCLLLPHWARMPMVVLATMATVIASQAV